MEQQKKKLLINYQTITVFKKSGYPTPSAKTPTQTGKHVFQKQSPEHPNSITHFFKVLQRKNSSALPK